MCFAIVDERMLVCAMYVWRKGLQKEMCVSKWGVEM